MQNSEATRLGNTLVGGDFNLNANGRAVSQEPGASLQVAGTFDPTGSGDVTLGGSGNLLPGYTPTGGANDITAQGVIELGTINEAGDLVVVSEASSLSFDGGPVAGDAVLLTDAANSIGGSVSFSTDAPAVTAGPDVQTGIRQGAGTTLTVAGQASFTAAPSSVPGSGFVDLTNSGNSFGSLLVSGRDVDVRQESGDLVVDGATATDSLQLHAGAGGISQTGAIRTPRLAVTSSGDIALTHAGNEVAEVAAFTDGGGLELHSAGDLEVGSAFGMTGIDTAGGDLGLTTGGSLSQTEALANVGAVAVDAAGPIDLSHAGNTLTSVASMAASGDVALENAAAGLQVSGDVTTNDGTVSVVTAGDLRLAADSDIEITGSGDVVLAAGQDFINDSVDANIALDDGRYLIYSRDPNRSEQGGLSADGSLFNRTYAADGPETIHQTGSQFIYSLVPVLTFSPESLAVLYGQEPVLTYTFEGLMDGHSAEMVFSGTPSLTSAATAGSDVGTYAIGIGAGSLVSEIGYDFDFDAAGALVTVNPASLTITAHDHSRLYGRRSGADVLADGFVLGEGVADLGGFSVIRRQSSRRRSEPTV
ncbi:MAG: MBG domain-containing protein [Gammaproteobacteria bacterium]|nr:MBG domain-containing protein [Gammaproteobacteria bacterium]